MLCRVWGVGMLSILALTTSNIILTLRLMQGRGVGGCENTNPGAAVIPQTVPRSWTSALSSYNQSEYLAFLRAASVNTSASRVAGVVVAAGDFQVDKGRGRWDARRSYKIHDSVFTGPRFNSLTEEMPVCLATQTSVDRLFWLAQVRDRQTHRHTDTQIDK